ncbi:uncharacterized protein LOC135955383 [Calliphora vicina]|uniref:uncharacterized protein LOC135955383 n=1 Tax=Calliphora vicina TaxID=7373 RepID=UPI00325AD035
MCLKPMKEVRNELRDLKIPMKRCSDVAQIVRLGVIPSDFPNTIWSDDKLKLIQAAVLDKIVEMKKGSIEAQFAGCSFKTGWLVFNCKGSDSAKWTKEHVPTLKSWQDAAIKVVSEDEVPKTEKFIGYFPEASETRNSRILSLIEGQNDDLTVEFWKVLNRVSKGSISKITIFSSSQAVVCYQWLSNTN